MDDLKIEVDADGLKQLADIITKTVDKQLQERQAEADKLAADAVRKTAPAFIASESASVKAYTEEVGIKAGRMLQAFAVSRSTKRDITDVLSGWKEDAKNVKRNMDAELFSIVKAQNTANPDGGFTIPQVLSTEIIGLLEAKAIVRSMGVPVYPLRNGNLRVPKMLSGLSAAYVGEMQPIVGSQTTMGTVDLSAKKLAALVASSNELLMYSNANIERILRDRLVNAMALREDLAFLRGTGAAGTPTGIRSRTNATHVIPASPVYSLATVKADLYRVVTMLQMANFDLGTENGYWIMSPRSKNAIMQLSNSLGLSEFEELKLKNQLLGFPVKTTTQIPTNLGATSDESEIYFVCASHCMIGDAMTLELTASDTAVFTDGVATFNTFTQDMMAIRAVSAHDFTMAHDLAAVILTNVTWGA